jgi:hypothetical protein
VSAQALVGVPIPSTGTPGHDLAELTVDLLNGPHGLFTTAVASPGKAFARLAGGVAAPTLLVDVRAPTDALDKALRDVRSLLSGLGATVTEGYLSWALYTASERRLAAHTDPRERLFDLWTGRQGGALPAITLAEWRAFLTETFRDTGFVVVEAKPEQGG